MESKDMGHTLAVGMTQSATEKVTKGNTAKTVGSGSMDVYATPAMACLMERASAELAQAHLPEGKTSVGISLQIEHKMPTPVGMEVRAEAKLIGIEGRKLRYEVRAFDEKDEIGSGLHERFIVDSDRFMEKAEGKYRQL